MKRWLWSITPVVLMLMAGPVLADDNDKPKDRPGPRGGEWRQKMLEEFDEDGDGKLNEDERKAAREARAERMGDGEGRRGRGRADGDRPARGPEGKPRRDGRHARPGGPEGRRGGPPGPGAPHERFRREGPPRPGDEFDGPGPGPGRPPSPEVMFERLDRDGDGQLSKEEFMAMRPPRMGPPPGGPRADDRRRPGPPPPRGEFRRDRGPRPEGDRPPRERDDDDNDN